MTRLTLFKVVRPEVLAAIALAAASTGAISVGSAAPSSPQTVRTPFPVDGLGVEGGLVGFAAGCGELYTWSPATGHSERVPREVTDCSSTGSYGDVAVAANKVVWVSLEEHNHLYLGVHVVRASNPAVVSSLYDAIDEDVGDLAAQGDVVAFSTQGGSYLSGPRATLWAGTTSRAAQFTTASGWMDRVAVEGDVVALGYRDGRVRLFLSLIHI